ncbi:MAG: DUF1552 domain-containing protein [Planctomycetes bacterium]|nr:DUF1552 domain-containing protein [Planctomycetota bacterium]
MKAQSNRFASSRRMSRQTVSRRSVLRGLGATLALPWLESRSVWGAEPKATKVAADGEAPVRFACVFAGNGFASKHWWAKGAGKEMELGEVLEPIAPFREKTLFVRGLFNANARGCGIHSCQTGNLLTGVKLASGGKISAGVSVDQRLAQHVGDQTPVKSLVLGCEKPYAGIHKGYSMLYSSHISWNSPTTPAPLEIYPAAAFDLLFGHGGARRADASVLDAVLGDAKSLRAEVSNSDRRKLDEYLDSIREVERRIENAGKERRLEGVRPGAGEPAIERPSEDLPQDIDTHMRLMTDLLVLAFQTDSTRVATLKLNNDHSGMRFPNLGIDHIIHHLLSHEDTNPDWLTVNQYFLSHLARMMERMDAIQEGERTLLDNSMILFCSSMLTGSHDNSQLPVVVCGGAGGQIETGRVLNYLEHDNRKMSSLYLSLMDKMGLHLNEFGDSTERLSEI